MKNKLNILWFAPYPYDLVFNRVESKFHPAPWITSLADEIKSEVNLTICNFHMRSSEIVEIEQDGIKFVFLPIRSPKIDTLFFKLMRIISIRRWIKNNVHKYNLIHVNGTEAQYGNGIGKVSIPIVTSIQGAITEYKKYYKPKLSVFYFTWVIDSIYEWIELKRRTNFICRTHWDKGVVSKNNSKAKIFHNWEFLRTQFSSFKPNFDSFNLLFVGGFNYIKGINEVFLAFNNLYNIDHRFQLYICGHASQNQIKELSLKLNLNCLDNIHLKGLVDAEQMLKLFKESFCLLHPTYIDNSPNSVCEAQFAGLPVIASNVGGLSSLIKHEIDGILVNRYSVSEIVDAVIELKANRKKYFLISENGILVAKERHNSIKIKSNLLAIYDEILQDWRSS